MKIDISQFSQSNILYGAANLQKQKSIDEYCQGHSVRLKNTFGELKGVGIDKIHEVRRRAFLAAGSGIQVFIVWRADEMTREASQALLKILEEPPKSAIFFLCARTLSLPATIISRASRFAFFGTEGQGEGDSEAAQMFANEIIKRKSELEQFVREKKTVPRTLVHRLEMLVYVSEALYTTRISPKYLIDSLAILS